MPVIPTYQQRTSAMGAGLGPGPRAAGSNFFQALAPVAERYEKIQQERAEERAAVAATDELMQARSHWLEELEKRKQAAPAGAPDFTPQTLKDFDADLEERINRAQSATARAWLRERLQQVRLGIQQEAMAFEASALAKLKLDGLASAADGARIAAEFRPGDFDAILEEQLTAIAASGLPDQARAELAEMHRATIADAAVLGLIRRDPRAALAELNNEQSANTAVQSLTFDARQRLRSAAEQEVRRLDAEAKANLTEARQAMADRLRDMQVAAAYGLPVEAPPKAVLVQLFGQHEGEQRHKQAQMLVGLSRDVAGIQQLSAEELITKLSEYQPKQVEGAADQEQMRSMFAGSVQQIIQQREKDPAGYMLANSRPVQQAWEAVARGDADAAQRYLSTVRAEKERLGVQSDAVLPQAYAGQLVNEIASLPAEGQVDRIQEEASRWGAAWPAIYGQIAKDLPDTAAVIGSGIPSAAATSLAAMSGLKSNELQALLPPSVKMTDVKDIVASEFEDFVASMPIEAARTTTAMLEAAERLTVKYMADGMNRGNAARKAFKDLIGSQYELRHFRGTTMRLPAQLDADALEAGARDIVSKFAVDSTMVVVPPGAALTAEEYAGRLQELIRERGYWVTNPSSTGLRLYLEGQPVERAGKPVDVAWSDLLMRGKSVPAEFGPTPYPMRHPYE